MPTGTQSGELSTLLYNIALHRLHVTVNAMGGSKTGGPLAEADHNVVSYDQLPSEILIRRHLLDQNQFLQVVVGKLNDAGAKYQEISFYSSSKHTWVVRDEGITRLQAGGGAYDMEQYGEEESDSYYSKQPDTANDDYKWTKADVIKHYEWVTVLPS